MPATTLNLTGSNRVEQGSSFSLRLRLSSDTLDFTGASCRGQIRPRACASNTVASFVCVYGSDVDGVYFDCSLSPAVTASIPCAITSGPTKSVTTFAYDIELVMAGGSVIRLLEGTVDVSPEVTR